LQKSEEMKRKNRLHFNKGRDILDGSNETQ
jgi:hypothetical protein